MMTDSYKRLGDYIREVDVRNRDLEVTKLLGVSISKEFMPSIANTIGTDMSSYKVVEPRQFAYGPVTSRNGDKVSIALYKGDEKAIVSQAYIIFEVKNKQELLPEYLTMWFRRPEFDRYARFKSHGSAREIFSWEEMCDVELPVPPIEQQQKIVSEYEAVTRRIRLNEQIIAKLEETAQALYRKMFVDGIDKENLPEGWRMGLKTGEVQNNVILETEEYISEAGLNHSSAKIIPCGSVIMAMYGATAGQVAYLDCEATTNQACCNMICHTKEDAAFLFFHLLYYQEEIKRLANGGAQENLSQEIIAEQPILLFEDDKKKATFVKLLDFIINKHKEYNILTELQSLLLTKIGQHNKLKK